MKTFTNHSAGPRGINLKGGSTRWIDPGESVDIDPKEIVGSVPDLGKAPATSAGATTYRIGDLTMAQVFTPNGLTDVSDMQAVFDAVEAAFADLVTKGEKGAAAPDADLIKAAVEGLDPKNDKHWTQAGLPEVAAVKEALGADVTRAQIEAAAPDVKRPATA